MNTPWRFSHQGDVTVFLPSGDSVADHALLEAARAQGRVVLVADSERDVVNGAEPGAWTYFAPKHRGYFETLLANASHVVSHRPDAQELWNACRKNARGPEKNEALFAFCCVADSAYLPFFFGLVENLRAVHGENLEVHLLGLDQQVAPAVKAQFPHLAIRVYSPKEIWEPREWDRIAARPLNERAYSSKPRILLKARENSEAEAVFLLDLDMHFFRSPSHLTQAFSGAHTLLFPQWSDQFSWARLHGSINSGIVGSRKGSEQLLSWWSQACWIHCELREEQGRFGDQGFLDQALVYFDGIRVYKEFDHDVAPWNRKTLDVLPDENRLTVCGGKAVGSFHAAGPDSDGIFETKYAWDQLVALFSVFADPNESAPLFKNTLEQQRRHWPSLDRAMRMRSLAAARTRLPVSPLNEHWAHKATHGWGSRFLGGLERLHTFYAQVRGHQTVADPENVFWVALQKAALFQPETLTTRRLL